MVFGETGALDKGLSVLGLAWSPVYLLSAKRPVLFEAGFACAGRLYERAVRAAAEKTPEHLFLTHVHWDHCGSAGYLKAAFPGLAIAASERAGAIMTRPNAVDLMRTLSDKLAPSVAALPGIDPSLVAGLPFHPFDVDLTVEDGRAIELEKDLTVIVIATPGHTRDHLSYYIPERRILFATEASGILDRAGGIVSQFLVDYDGYISSLERISRLPVDILCPGHHFVFIGRDEVRRFLSRSMSETVRFRDRVFELLTSTSGDVEEVIRRIKAEQWDTNTGVKQHEAAYLLNLRAQVVHLSERLGRSPAG